MPVHAHVHASTVWRYVITSGIVVPTTLSTPLRSASTSVASGDDLLWGRTEARSAPVP